VTTDYVWDPSARSGQAVAAGPPTILQETAGGQTTYYVYGLDLIASVQGGMATYYLTDGLGSTRELADGGRTVSDTYDNPTAPPGPGENGTRIGELP